MSKLTDFLRKIGLLKAGSGDYYTGSIDTGPKKLRRKKSSQLTIKLTTA